MYASRSPERIWCLNSIRLVSCLIPLSLHLAVYLLDFFMDNFDVSRNQLNLVAMGCLSVAAKFEEKEEDIPKQNVLREGVWKWVGFTFLYILG